jgi:hypothetical protein
MPELICKIEKLVSEEFVDDDGEVYRAELLPGLSAAEVAALTAQMPTATLPQEIHKLLLYTKGLEFGWLQQVNFDAFGEFGLQGLFPTCIELMSDGAGNFWVLDINKLGEWGAVFYVCHDPQVIIRQADNLEKFLDQLYEYASLKSDSWLDEVYNQLSIKIWEERKMHASIMDVATAIASPDPIINQFAAQQPIGFLLIDLRAEASAKGFAHDKLSFRTGQVRKHDLEPIWAFEPPQLNWFQRLLGG